MVPDIQKELDSAVTEAFTTCYVPETPELRRLAEKVRDSVCATLAGEPDKEWISFVLEYSDIFGHDYIGYWARGVSRSKKPSRGWLLWEFEMDPRSEDLGFIDRLRPDDEKALHAEAVSCWEAGQPLPPHYHKLGEREVRLAWVYGFLRGGRTWYEDGDANTYDVALQQALLGEVRYG